MTVMTPDLDNGDSMALDHVHKLVKSALWAPEHYHDVITLTCAATHFKNQLSSACRLLFLGEPGSGKSTGLTLASYLAKGTTEVTGVLAMTGPSYVADYRLNEDWTPTIDELHQLFGLLGVNGGHSKFYAYLNQGYLRRTAWAQYQENRVPVRIPIFGFAFLAGLGLACPPDLRQRSIILKLEKPGDDVAVADFSDPQVDAAFTWGQRCLESWAAEGLTLPLAEVRELHPKLVHRVMDVWGPLAAVALAAGGTWPKRFLVAFERLQLNGGVPVHPPAIQILLDYLLFSELHGANDVVASGEFAVWARSLEHGTYMRMRPGQFRQFAVSNLGPTDTYYDPETQGTRRGWTEVKHQLNLRRAKQAKKAIETRQERPEPEQQSWKEDF